MKKIVLGIILLHTIACSKSRKEKIADFLTEGEQKYWTAVMNHPIKRYLNVCYNINGTYSESIVSGSGQRSRRMLYFDPTWELMNDSTIVIGNADTFKIEYINSEVLVLNQITYRTKKNKVFVYIKSQDQISKPSVGNTTL